MSRNFNENERIIKLIRNLIIRYFFHSFLLFLYSSFFSFLFFSCFTFDLYVSYTICLQIKSFICYIWHKNLLNLFSTCFCPSTSPCRKFWEISIGGLYFRIRNIPRILKKTFFLNCYFLSCLITLHIFCDNTFLFYSGSRLIWFLWDREKLIALTKWSRLT
jgi:hypothetical protein